MFCKHCGSPIDDDSTFCPDCGKSVVRTNQPVNNVDPTPVPVMNNYEVTPEPVVSEEKTKKPMKKGKKIFLIVLAVVLCVALIASTIVGIKASEFKGLVDELDYYRSQDIIESVKFDGDDIIVNISDKFDLNKYLHEDAVCAMYYCVFDTYYNNGGDQAVKYPESSYYNTDTTPMSKSILVEGNAYCVYLEVYLDFRYSLTANGDSIHSIGNRTWDPHYEFYAFFRYQDGEMVKIDENDFEDGYDFNPTVNSIIKNETEEFEFF